jgi:23S rRNA (guanosine2251-2'-O)-methyltransferase
MTREIRHGNKRPDAGARGRATGDDHRPARQDNRHATRQESRQDSPKVLPKDSPKDSRYESRRKPGQEPRRERSSSERREARDGDVVRLYGFHSVAAALKAPRRELIRLYATAAAAERLAAEIAARGVETRIVSAEDIAARTPREAVHQGVLLEARPLGGVDISELPERGLVLVLDQITDPHNVGAIFRTAAAFAVDAVITTERHTPEFTGALAKSASGGLEHVPICSVTNLARAMGELADIGYWRVGLDSQAPDNLAQSPLSRPLALVLGAEGKGMRRLTREHCDSLARLDLPGAIKSLNVSNACAIALSIAYDKTTPKS